MIKDVEVKGDLVKIKVDKKYENALLALKAYLSQAEDVELAGVSSDHYLVNEADFVVKVKKGSPINVIVKTIEKAITDLEDKKLK